MCKFQFKKLEQKPHNILIKKQIDEIPVGSSVFIKCYDVKTHQKYFTHGVLIAKRGKGTSSHILIRRIITKEVVTTSLYIYSNTFLGIGLLGKNKETPIAKKYNFLLKPTRWKYM